MKYHIESTKQFDKWFSGIKDSIVKMRLLARFSRVENGNFGDCKQLSSNLYEMRFFFGAGLRIYYTIKKDMVVILLTGGDKSSQSGDIIRAKGYLSELEDEI